MATKVQTSKRSTDKINILNIFLMLISAAFAFAWPFYCFLIAYAVLGPLHYLTEISWLHDRSYFTNDKRDYLFLVVASVIYGCCLIPGIHMSQLFANIVLVALVVSLLFVMTKDVRLRIVIAVLGLLAAWFVPISFGTVITSMLLLTMVHVFVFTGCFIFFGAMKSSSVTGYISGIVFLALGAMMFLFTPMPNGGMADSFVITHYDHAFGDLNIWFLRAFHLSQAGNSASDPFEFSPGATAVMRFIAFAYLYHYLNWFSKTKIIRWHEVSKRRLAGVAVLWCAAITVYAIDYDLGVKVLFFLSALHVLLEFPLDFRTIIGIGSELRKRVRPKELELSGAS